MVDGRKGSYVEKPPPIMGGGYDSCERGARNVLTWDELGGLDKLTKCEKVCY